jgi:hypothetical protein
MLEAGKSRKFRFVLILVLLMGSFIHSDVFGKSYVYPLKISDNKRYLVDQNGTAFYWSGDAAWSLIAQLTKPDCDYYIQNRKDMGFTVIMVNLIERHFSIKPPKNIYGESPFTGRTFTTPNERYFEHADYVIRIAEQKGIVVLLAPLYLGYNCGPEGWCAEVQAASLDDMRTWGCYLGDRYKDFKNLVWLIGSDADPIKYGVREKLREFVRGIRDYDTVHLITAHNNPESMAVDPYDSNDTWLTINNIYSYSTTLYENFRTAYNRSPTLPFLLIESAYENEHNITQRRLRSQIYWTLLSGGFGGNFGNCPIWHFGYSSSWCGLTDWKSQLDAQGSLNMVYAQSLFKSFSWELLEPDFNHNVLTSGNGTWGQNNYATAALTSDGNTMIAYLPTKRQVRVDMNKISGPKAKCWWYNPSNGSTVEIGTFETSGNRLFMSPTRNDWVLVIDGDI